MARLPTTPDCHLKGCTRAAFKGGLCRKHWYSIPFADRLHVAVRAMGVSMAAAKTEHRRLRQIARKIEASERN